MSRDERMLDQNDPNIDTIASLQRSITATLTYLMGRASVPELFGLQAYLSQMALEVTRGDSGGVSHRPQPVHDKEYWDNDRREEMPTVLRQQMLEIERHNARLKSQMEQANCTAPQYRREG